MKIAERCVIWAGAAGAHGRDVGGRAVGAVHQQAGGRGAPARRAVPRPHAGVPPQRARRQALRQDAHGARAVRRLPAIPSTICFRLLHRLTDF